tara:strand:+ start:410 stop:763 length:354 start_codon:yes stop_codon:yes gene_type:complete
MRKNKINLKLVVAIGLTFLTIGCATILNKKLDTYKGKDIFQAQKQFGFKFTSRKLKNGHTAYTWIKSRSANWIYQNMRGTSTDKCVIFIVANTTGKIISTQFKDTHAANLTCYKYIN